MKNTKKQSIVANIYKDIDIARPKEIDEIYLALKRALKEFDRDSALKNSFDFTKSLFKSKREKCKLILADIMDSADNLNEQERENLRKELLDISNIHRTLLENLRSLISAL